MAVFSKASGRKITCMELAFTSIKTERGIEDSSIKIRKRVLEFIIGKMGEFMKATGLKESNTDWASTSCLTIQSNSDSGKKAKE